MLSIVFPWSDGIKCFVVNAAKPLSAVNIFPDPFRKFGLNQFLPILSNGSFLLVQYPNLIAVGINFGIEDADILLVQGLLKNVVGINPFGAVGGKRLDIAAIHGFTSHIPFAGMGRIQYMDFVTGIGTGANHFKKELLVDLFWHPVDTNADSNFSGSQIHRLHRSQSFHIAL